MIVHSKTENSSAVWSGLEKAARYKKTLVVLFLVLTFLGGMAANRARQERHIAFARYDYKHGLNYFTDISNYLIRPEWEPPHLDIDINFKNYLFLEFLRKRTLGVMKDWRAQGNIAPQENKRYVKASLGVDGEKFPAKIRLKGIGVFHYLEGKWSMRVSMKGQNRLLGLKEFSLTHPKRRAMFFYWLLNQTLEREGLISIRTPLVDVSINGRHKGIYSLEEIPRKELIANNQRREGVIVRYNQFHFVELSTHPGRSFDDSYYSSESTFAVKYKETSNELLKQMEIATSLLESFRRGDLEAHEVFNVKRYATYLAICDTMNTWHGGSWSNMRFYYDPVLALLEPVPWDSFDEDELWVMRMNGYFAWMTG
ncbi:hypothetical protein UZ36_06885 [Candidatus Nitromaritima sp. SCGC AAA799-C22]|nr:hypothetical protein UZ36_06885 [Candidatus Nitromaritima sp. SCGC AAA799-C22]